MKDLIYRQVLKIGAFSMPLTFAHPAAILPFSRKSQFINFSAMVLGSMAPDFEYFLRGKPLGEFGHTLSGFMLLNLPLVAVIYFIYHIFIHQVLTHHLPLYLQDGYYPKRENPNNFLRVLVFCYSALIGMVTHVVWDSFTHVDGYMVMNYSIFTNTYHVYEFKVPLYKLLQHGSTVAGLMMIFIYMYVRALSTKNNLSKVSLKQKTTFWFTILSLTITFMFLWNIVDYVSIFKYGILVVRIIDSFFISLFIVSIVFKNNVQNSKNLIKQSF
ncbi:DUF4184 family protein [Fictibacillus barbaricus]|uniref:DUF4184 family protein n=1 Tax=Fictibacillus barbaricus TaxID=182136 RepID=UPI001F08E63C|nr:DUF4184 family protein [Fictibacillus barbaricus]